MKIQKKKKKNSDIKFTKYISNFKNFTFQNLFFPKDTYLQFEKLNSGNNADVQKKNKKTEEWGTNLKMPKKNNFLKVCSLLSVVMRQCGEVGENAQMDERNMVSSREDRGDWK